MRTIEEITAEQDSVIHKFPNLSAIDSVSDVSFFAQIRKMYALLVQMLEESWAKYRQELEYTIANTQVGSLPWYVSKIKAFQYGDGISILNGMAQYNVIDIQKQIIAQAAAIEDKTTGRIGIRVAKLESGVMVPLSMAELDAVRYYAEKVKYAGVILDVVSIPADDVKLVVVCRIDRQIINSNGSLLSSSDKYPVTEAISNFLSHLPENSVLNNTELTDYLQGIPGVKDFSINESFVRRPTSSNWSAYSREVVSSAGHARLHNDSHITYIL